MNEVEKKNFLNEKNLMVIIKKIYMDFEKEWNLKLFLREYKKRKKKRE